MSIGNHSVIHSKPKKGNKISITGDDWKILILSYNVILHR